MDTEAKIQPSQDAARVEEMTRKRSSLSSFFRFKGLSGFSESATTIETESSPRIGKRSTLMRLLNKKQPNGDEEKPKAQPEKRNSFLMRSLGSTVPWLGRKVSQMNIHRTDSKSVDLPAPGTSNDGSDQIHEALIASSTE
jgi:hypothetical protein